MRFRNSPLPRPRTRIRKLYDLYNYFFSPLIDAEDFLWYHAPVAVAATIKYAGVAQG